MWLNQFKISFRNLLKSRLYSTINILGLALGLSCSIIISLWIWDEISMDQFHDKTDNIYQLLGQLKSEGQVTYSQYSPSALAQPIKDRLPEIEYLSRVFPSNVVFQYENKKISESGLYADPDFLKIFSYPLKEGTINEILKPTNSIVISSDLANKYFGNTSALGKTISITQPQNEKNDFLVTGVLKPLPKQSSLQFDYILAYEAFENRYRPWWNANNSGGAYTNFNVTSYVRLKDGVDIEQFNTKLSTFINDFTGQKYDDHLISYQFNEIYLHTNLNEGSITSGKIEYVRLFSIIGILVLLIACINFMNLTTARAGKRAKEVGVRKIVGANRLHLWSQFVLESLLLSIIAMAIALTLSDIFLPVFNSITGKQMEMPFGSFYFVIAVISLTLITGLLAGLYPALFISSFKPINTLKNKISEGGLHGLRKGLVIFQFTLSIIFISGAIIIYEQIDFFQNKDLGIQKDNIIHHPLNNIKFNGKEAFKNEVLAIPGVSSIAFTEQHPMGTSNGNRFVTWSGKPEEALIYFNVMQVDRGVIETFELRLIEGSNFPQNYSKSDERLFIINETAASAMMINDPVGQEMTVWGGKGKVVGVVKDFHHRSLMESIEPVVMIYNPEEVWNSFIKIDKASISTSIERIKEVYTKYETEYAFDYIFVEDEFNSNYDSIIAIGRLNNTFSIAAILISCMGLFGLSAFITEQKTKETGIRKVLGASEFSLVKLFSSGFIRLIVISLVIAIPIAWWYAEQWLANFAYRIELSLAPFAIASGSALLIALITISYNTIKAAVANPVDTLKYE